MRYGILIGRFQPLHIGHQTIIDEIISDGLIPIIFIGSTGDVNDRNPLSYSQRANLIHTVYPGILTLPLPDNECNERWASQTVRTLTDINIKFFECKLYFYHKKDDFNISHLLEDWFEIHKPKSEIIDICASKIRNDLKTYRYHLDSKVYKKYVEMIK